ncbi:hypothetical protein [Catellatospora sp. NPDC049609]|uniref:hypothetical protein n=1 Tax=Catellatospora sp. NPDC049609 TaxID=3155505 RepID=UPI0034312198
MLTHRFGDLELGFIYSDHVHPPAGFRALPGVLQGSDWIMCVRDATGGDLVEPPTRLSDTLPIWEPVDPVPPQGYRALSRVAAFPPVAKDLLACVRDDYCHAADFIKGHVVLEPYEGGDRVFLLPPHNQTITRPPYVLSLPVAAEMGQLPVPPSLTSRERPEFDDEWQLYRATVVPFPAVRDAGRDTAWRVANSPFYRLELWRRYDLVAFLDNQTTLTQRVGDTYTTGVTRTVTDTFTTSTTITVSAQAGVGIKGVNIGGSVSVAVTLGYSHAVAVAQMESRAVTRQIDVPAGHAGAIFVEDHRLLVRRADGSVVPGGELVFKANESFVALQYPPAADGDNRLDFVDESVPVLADA